MQWVHSTSEFSFLIHAMSPFTLLVMDAAVRFPTKPWFWEEMINDIENEFLSCVF